MNSYDPSMFSSSRVVQLYPRGEYHDFVFHLYRVFHRIGRLKCDRFIVQTHRYVWFRQGQKMGEFTYPAWYIERTTETPIRMMENALFRDDIIRDGFSELYRAPGLRIYSIHFQSDEGVAP
jgi:hypothetical protein